MGGELAITGKWKGKRWRGCESGASGVAAVEGGVEMVEVAVVVTLGGILSVR